MKPKEVGSKTHSVFASMFTLVVSMVGFDPHSRGDVTCIASSYLKTMFYCILLLLEPTFASNRITVWATQQYRFIQKFSNSLSTTATAFIIIYHIFISNLL